MYCSNCGQTMSNAARACPHCGHPNHIYGEKNKVVFVLLALFLGTFGIHRMYIGDVALGVVYLLFFWTLIPGIVALFEAIVIGLRRNDPRFAS